MGFLVRLILLLSFISFGSGCANKTLVALAPDPDGKVGALTVTTDAGSVAIDQAYQATTVHDPKEVPTKPAALEKDAVDRMFAEALSIQPKRPEHFLLYFDKETTLNAASQNLIPAILAGIRERGSEDISVIGHTDTVGSAEYNTELSRRRAAAVKELLVGQGVPPDAVRVTSHGKENPLVPTGDNVYEPRNRRVEVDVR